AGGLVEQHRQLREHARPMGAEPVCGCDGRPAAPLRIRTLRGVATGDLPPPRVPPRRERSATADGKGAAGRPGPFRYAPSGRSHGADLPGPAPPETSHLAGYRHVESEERRRLEKKQQEDLARADTHPLADLTTTELQQRQINSLKRRVRSLTKERNRLRSRLDRTLTSRSWRWTRPLRVISATVAHWRSTS